MNKMKKLILLVLITAIITSCSDSNHADSDVSDGVDIDLTQLSMIMVYSEVNNIYASPDDYIGKVIKVRGTYGAEYYDVTDTNYHYVLFADATACCTAGIEFIWNGEHNYPADYPTDGDMIEICGKFGAYDELGLTYYYLSVDEIMKS